MRSDRPGSCLDVNTRPAAGPATGAGKPWRGLASLAVALVGCGGDDRLRPGAGDDPGAGTGTLRIDAAAAAAPFAANGTDPRAFVTSFAVVVERAGVAVDAAAVTMTSAGGPVALTFDTRDGGSWRGQQLGYFEVYRLDVIAGADRVEEVHVDGPDPAVITAPTAGATVDSTAPLAVAWTRRDAAPIATLATRATAAAPVVDAGAATLAAGALGSRPDGVVAEELRLVRSAAVTPAGAVAGSRFAVAVEQRQDVVVAATGTATGL